MTLSALPDRGGGGRGRKEEGGKSQREKKRNEMKRKNGGREGEKKARKVEEGKEAETERRKDSHFYRPFGGIFSNKIRISLLQPQGFVSGNGASSVAVSVLGDFLKLVWGVGWGWTRTTGFTSDPVGTGVATPLPLRRRAPLSKSPPAPKGGKRGLCKFVRLLKAGGYEGGRLGVPGGDVYLYPDL